jgi:hypothetical protein
MNKYEFTANRIDQGSEVNKKAWMGLTFRDDKTKTKKNNVGVMSLAIHARVIQGVLMMGTVQAARDPHVTE